MKTIKDYIQFWIGNWYKFECLQKWELLEKLTVISINKVIINDDDWGCAYVLNLIELITSKEFIEAIGRGLKEKWWYEDVLWLWGFTHKSDFNNFIVELTHIQADAIRDNKLEEFINNLLRWII